MKGDAERMVREIEGKLGERGFLKFKERGYKKKEGNYLR